MLLILLVRQSSFMIGCVDNNVVIQFAGMIGHPKNNPGVDRT